MSAPRRAAQETRKSELLEVFFALRQKSYLYRILSSSREMFGLTINHQMIFSPM